MSHLCNNEDMKKRKLIIYFNAPITLTFVAICILALILDGLTGGASTNLIFSTYKSSLLSPFYYIRLIGHVFGHASWDHLINNMIYILLLGPMLEEKYHDKLIYVILVTAAVTGIANSVLQPGVQLLGASGVVFAFILLASITGDNHGIPVTLIIAVIFWIGGQIYDGLFVSDTVSQLTHILGGICGAFIGMRFKNGG